MINQLKNESIKEIIKSIFKAIMYWVVWVVFPIVTASVIFNYNSETEPDELGSKIIISIFSVVTISFVIVIVIMIIRLMGGLYKKNYMKAIDKALKTMSMEEIEKDYRMAISYGPNLKIGDNFTWFLKPRNGVVMIMNEDLVWVYEDVDEINYSAYGIFTYFKIKKQYLMFVDRKNHMYAVRMKNMDIKNALTQYTVKYKYIINGYDKGYERMREKNFGRMLNMVEQKKRELRERELAIKEYNKPKFENEVENTPSPTGFRLKL